MSPFYRHITEEERQSLEMAEDSREGEWMHPSFISRLFQGRVEWNLIYPFPDQTGENKRRGDEFLSNLKEFLKKNLNPDEVDVTREIPFKVLNGLRQMGLFAVKIPKEYGGLDMGQVNFSRIVHLLGSYCGSTAALLSAHQSIGVPQPLILFGTEQQKKEYLPKFSKGAISGFALTEPEAGSDPRQMKTTATPTEDGKYYLINGEKLWCTNGNIADILLVMAQTPPKIINGKEKKQITAFIVETNTPGFEVTYRCKFMGLNAIQNGLIKFNNVKVPKENVVLGEGQGLKLAFITLNTGRLSLPALVTGTSKWCLYVARRWAKERKQWGAPIGEHEAIASKLSSMAAAVFAMDAMTWLVSHMSDDKKFDIRLEAAMAKLFCTEENWKIINDAIQIRGGRGYETGPSLRGRGKAGFPLERIMRDSRINTILEGTSEIMHLFIAREALDFHLKGFKLLLDPKVPIFHKIKMALSLGFRYLLWYPRLWAPSLLTGRAKLHGPLEAHMEFVRSASKRLARELFHKMVFHQQKLVARQNTINRFVDIGMELFAMSGVCSYAQTLHKKGQVQKNAVELADLFCFQTRDRIKKLFRDVCHNRDGLVNSTAKKLLAGDYEWLEHNIFKEATE